MLANSFKCFLVAARWPQYVFFGWPHVGLKKKNCWWPHVGRKRNVFGGRTFPQHKSKKMVAARWPQHFFLGGRTLASNIFFWWPHVGFKKKWWLTLASNIFFGGRTLASRKTIVVAHIGLESWSSISKSKTEVLWHDGRLTISYRKDCLIHFNPFISESRQ